jgi:Protein of unknown function (DUF2628)
MSVYTVHQPPGRDVDPLPEAERIIFVRDGFSFWAFLFAPLWMLWHGMWLVLAGYVVVVAALETLLVAVGASSSVTALVGFMLSLLIGLEASTLRRFSLRLRGWANAGIVSGDDVEDAERRYFDAWLRDSSASRGAAMPQASASAAPAAMPYGRPGSDVIGLFPEPGARR